MATSTGRNGRETITGRSKRPDALRGDGGNASIESRVVAASEAGNPFAPRAADAMADGATESDVCGRPGWSLPSACRVVPAGLTRSSATTAYEAAG
ncbi:hypothetical protein [Paracraurococcus ruber]|uniref:hypothetical protein n=1 Tax=Paracraurococcus ruber TaxID=77675 RepID=UPI001057663F|nr:hypothetical protein [Paracraurococcus ruber]TDG34213.1 hypothetical protein E2C05_00210 [Paracraurococcus ruber]